MPALNVLVAALVDRKAKVESVEVVYGKKSITTPDMRPKNSFNPTRQIVPISIKNRSGLHITRAIEPNARIEPVMNLFKSITYGPPKRLSLF